MRTRHVMLLTTLLVLALATASAAYSPEGSCQKSRYYQAGKYAYCVQQQLGKYYYNLYSGLYSWENNALKLSIATAKCVDKNNYKGPSYSCHTPRFQDNGDGTVTDWLTGLQWEKKTNDGTIHDKDNLYMWSSGTQANSAAFTTFLRTLNSNSCFAGHCNWRLPTFAELNTIRLTDCDEANWTCTDPVFGPTDGFYSSDITDKWSPLLVWTVRFDVNQEPHVDATQKSAWSLLHARAVRSAF